MAGVAGRFGNDGQDDVPQVVELQSPKRSPGHHAGAVANGMAVMMALVRSICFL
jgi:hypothetical protein